MTKRGALFLMMAAAVLCLCGIANAQKTITLGVFQEPENLNTYIGVQTVITYVHKPFAEYLIDVNEKGEYSSRCWPRKSPPWKTAECPRMG